MNLKEKAEQARADEHKLWEALQAVNAETQGAADRRDAALIAWNVKYREAEALELVAKLEAYPTDAMIAERRLK